MRSVARRGRRVLLLRADHEIVQYNLIWRIHDAFNRQFEKLRRVYGGLLALALAHRAR